MAAAQDQGQKPAQPQPSPSAAPSPSPETASPGDSTQLEPIKTPRPYYPQEAADKRLQGEVWISLLISETGDVEGTEIISGDPVLAKAAQDAMRKWKFKPYIRNGKPVKVRTKVPYDFAFRDKVDDRPTDPNGALESTPPGGAAGGSPASDTSGAVSHLRVSQGVMEGLLVHRVNPVYPPEARSRYIEGDVILQATIGKDGRIHNLRAVSGHPVLVEASIGAVQQWRYRPYLLKGEPVEVETTIKVQFHM